MKTRQYRYFGGLLTAQENYLNRQAQRGLRLVDTGKLTYRWEACPSGQVQYRVEFVGHKSREKAEDYRAFLEGMGYRVWVKPVNLSLSVGKVRYRPWAEKGGRLATRSTTFDRELFIVEKRNDGAPFDLHTTFEDRMDYYRTLRAPWLTFFLVFGLLGVASRSWVAALFGLASLIPAGVYHAQIRRLKRESRTREW